MPKHIEKPVTIEAVGNKPKLIEEFVGLVTTTTPDISIARMRSPAGWVEPGQRPAFDEYSLVLEGILRVEHEDGVIDVKAGQAVVAHKGEWVRYSTPEGAVYVAICLPAFAPDIVHRDP